MLKLLPSSSCFSCFIWQAEDDAEASEGQKRVGPHSAIVKPRGSAPPNMLQSMWGAVVDAMKSIITDEDPVPPSTPVGIKFIPSIKHHSTMV